MVFCVSIAHSEHTCAQYNEAGIPAEHIDGTHTDAEREAALTRFRDGETLVLCTVQLAIEGLDIPAVEAVQQLRPTQSVIVYLQLIGRGLRVEEGKDELVILDQVNNWKRHGLPDDVREWSLDGRKKRKRSAKDEDPDIHIQQCKDCFHIFRKGPPACPECGVLLVVTGRKIEQVDGDLAEVDLEAVRRERGLQQGRARELPDLVRVGVTRGMKNPSAWAAIVYAQRQGRKPTPMEFKLAKDHYERITAAVADPAGAF
jgi:superfamily II DNA or RNA helicase